MIFDNFIESLDGNHPLKQYPYDESNKVRVAFYKELKYAFEQLSGDSNNTEWFDKKIDSLKSDVTIENISSILGELRAYSIIKSSYFGNNLICNNNGGADFITKTIKNNNEILIEVNTPLGRSDEIRTTVSHQEISDGEVTIQTIGKAPFGYPQRKIDNFQSEGISKIRSVKEDEKQFNDNSINILFVDYVNPFFNDHLDILKDQQKPYIIFQKQIRWGEIWHAFYAKKEDEIFDGMNNLNHNNGYLMEYDGRFHDLTKINFVFINLIDCMAIYESFNDSIDDSIYPMIYSLNKLNYEDIWINWPIENLKARIDNTRNIGIEFDKKYFM